MIDLTIHKEEELSKIESDKFKKMVDAIG